jgi:hypothetical protein
MMEFAKLSLYSLLLARIAINGKAKTLEQTLILVNALDL